MDKLKTVVRNEYFPAAAVLFGVVLFWTLGMLGGLSLLSSGQSPVTILSWLLFVYAAAVLSPLAGLLAASDLIRRWLRHRSRQAGAATAGLPGTGSPAANLTSAKSPSPTSTSR